MFVFTAFHYPELNSSHQLRSTWVRTGENTGRDVHIILSVIQMFFSLFPVLLEVPEQQVAERSFKARLERRLALLLEEGLQASSRRRWRRATAVGNHSLQVSTQVYRVNEIYHKGL